MLCGHFQVKLIEPLHILHMYQIWGEKQTTSDLSNSALPFVLPAVFFHKWKAVYKIYSSINFQPFMTFMCVCEWEKCVYATKKHRRKDFPNYFMISSDSLFCFVVQNKKDRKIKGVREFTLVAVLFSLLKSQPLNEIISCISINCFPKMFREC